MEPINGCFNQRLVVNELLIRNSEVSNGVKEEVVAGKEDIEYFNEGIIEPVDNLPFVEYNSNGDLVEMNEMRGPETELDENSQALEGEVLDSVDLIKNEDESEKTVEYFGEETREQSEDNTLMAHSNSSGILEKRVERNCHHLNGRVVDTGQSIEIKENASPHTGQLRLHPDLTILKEEINGGYIPEHDVYEEYYTCHEKSDTEMVYKCSNCTFSTSYKRVIENHILLLHMRPATIVTEKVKKCSFPGCNFQTIHDLKKHEHDVYEEYYTCHEKSDTEMVYKCSNCTFSTSYKRVIENHILLLHMRPATIVTEKVKKCSFPGCNFQTIHDLKKHEQKHSNVFHKCDKCSFQTKRKSYLSSHVIRVHGKSLGMEILRCHDCSYEATIKANLIQHQEVHKKPEERKVFKCTFTGCSYEAICRRTLNRHSLKHKDPSQIEILKCTKCPYYSMEKGGLRKHIRSVHGNEQEVFICDKCRFRTHRKPSMIRHVLIHTNRVEMFKCPYCSYESKRKGNLTQHLVKHKSSSDVEMFKCAMCSFETKRKHCLKSHIVTHKNSKNRR